MRKKNDLLKRERGISFEDFLRKIEEGRLLDDIRHPNADEYPNQRIFIVELENYALLIFGKPSAGKKTVSLEKNFLKNNSSAFASTTTPTDFSFLALNQNFISP